MNNKCYVTARCFSPAAGPGDEFPKSRFPARELLFPSVFGLSPRGHATSLAVEFVEISSRTHQLWIYLLATVTCITRTGSSSSHRVYHPVDPSTLFARRFRLLALQVEEGTSVKRAVADTSLLPFRCSPPLQVGSRFLLRRPAPSVRKGQVTSCDSRGPILFPVDCETLRGVVLEAPCASPGQHGSTHLS